MKPVDELRLELFECAAGDDAHIEQLKNFAEAYCHEIGYRRLRHGKRSIEIESEQTPFHSVARFENSFMPDPLVPDLVDLVRFRYPG